MRDLGVGGARRGMERKLRRHCVFGVRELPPSFVPFSLFFQCFMLFFFVSASLPPDPVTGFSRVETSVVIGGDGWRGGGGDYKGKKRGLGGPTEDRGRLPLSAYAQRAFRPNTHHKKRGNDGINREREKGIMNSPPLSSLPLQSIYMPCHLLTYLILLLCFP